MLSFECKITCLSCWFKGCKFQAVSHKPPAKGNQSSHWSAEYSTVLADSYADVSTESLCVWCRIAFHPREYLMMVGLTERSLCAQLFPGHLVWTHSVTLHQAPSRQRGKGQTKTKDPPSLFLSSPSLLPGCRAPFRQMVTLIRLQSTFNWEGKEPPLACFSIHTFFFLSLKQWFQLTAVKPSW